MPSFSVYYSVSIVFETTVSCKGWFARVPCIFCGVRTRMKTFHLASVSVSLTRGKGGIAQELPWPTGVESDTAL